MVLFFFYNPTGAKFEQVHSFDDFYKSVKHAWNADDFGGEEGIMFGDFGGGGGSGGGDYSSFYNRLFNQVSKNGTGDFSDFSTRFGTNKKGESGTWVNYSSVLNDGVYGGFGKVTSLNSIVFGKFFLCSCGCS